MASDHRGHPSQRDDSWAGNLREGFGINMNDCTLLARQLYREARATGAYVHDCYYLFDNYDERPENWPERNDGVDDEWSYFCLDCANARTAEARAAGVLMRDDLDYGHPDRYEAYSGPSAACGTEHDTVPFCADCGKVLSFSPTSYCVETELDGFSQENSRGSRSSSEDLLVMAKLLDGADRTKDATALLKCAADTLAAFHVPPSVELRQRLPSVAKIRGAWKALKKEIERTRYARD